MLPVICDPHLRYARRLAVDDRTAHLFLLICAERTGEERSGTVIVNGRVITLQGREGVFDRAGDIVVLQFGHAAVDKDGR